MAIVAMSKVNILLHKEYKAQVLELLQEKGVMDITDISEGKGLTEVIEENLHKLDFKIAEVDFALNFLKQDAPTYKGMEGLILGEKTKIKSLDEVDEIRTNFPYLKVIEECKSIEENTNALQSQTVEQSQIIEILAPWENLGMDLNSAFETKTTKLIIGFLKKNRAENCLAEFEESFLLGEKGVLDGQGEQIACWFLVEKNELKEVEIFLQKHEFTECVLSKQDGTPKEIIKSLRKKQTECVKEIEHLKKKRKELAKQVPNLKIVYDYLNWLKGKEKVKQQFLYTESIVFIQGFIPKKELDDLTKNLTQIDRSVVLEELEITAEDNIPVDLENNSFVKPFEGVMKLFGLPSAREADPTPYLTPFFLVFFGFCITDAGYGLIMGVGLWLLLKSVKFPTDLKNMLKLLMYAGWATVLMGVLFGGYFGLTVDQAPAWMVNTETGRFKLQVFDPINNLNAVMGFAYGLGLIHLWLGTFLKGMNQFKNNKWEAIQTSFVYNLLVIAIIFLTLAKTEVFLPQMAGIFEKIVYINVALAIWGSGYGQKFYVRPLIGLIVFVQEVINLFSAVLSYSRLFALGMSTGIIALVFNTIALTTLDLLPIFLAIPVMIMILLAGHLLNIALNVLGGFIHSARLQFVEFFGKFLVGGGKDFVPFKKEMKYIVVDLETGKE